MKFKKILFLTLSILIIGASILLPSINNIERPNKATLTADVIPWPMGAEPNDVIPWPMGAEPNDVIPWPMG